MSALTNACDANKQVLCIDIAEGALLGRQLVTISSKDTKLDDLLVPEGAEHR